MSWKKKREKLRFAIIIAVCIPTYQQVQLLKSLYLSKYDLLILWKTYVLEEGRKQKQI